MDKGNLELPHNWRMTKLMYFKNGLLLKLGFRSAERKFNQVLASTNELTSERTSLVMDANEARKLTTFWTHSSVRP